MERNFICLFLIVAGIGAGSAVFADEYTSSSFKVLDPAFNESGAISTSTSYRLLGVIGELAPGLATSTSFRVNAGSGVYPEVTIPTLAATAGGKQVLLAWNAAQGSLGWTVSGYDVCMGTVADTYSSCTNVGNVTNYAQIYLTVGTRYYFRLRVKDAFSNVIARSNEASAIPYAPSESSVPPSAPAGEGGSAAIPTTVVTLKGRAYPEAAVSLLLDGVLVREVAAKPDATFSGIMANVSSGALHTFGTIAKDSEGRSSILLTYTVNIPQTVTAISIENIFIPPTLDLSAVALVRGQTLDLNGQAFPQSTVNIRIESLEPIERMVQANIGGAWLFSVGTASFEDGAHSARAKARVGNEESTFGYVHTFTVSSTLEEQEAACSGADINGDGRVNLSDFSILLSYWNATATGGRCADLNGDGRVNLADFSIMLFFWTG